MIRFRRPRSVVHTLRRTLAALLAVAALVLALRDPHAAAGAAGRSTIPVAVAATDLAPGTVLDGAALRVAAYPAALVPAGTSRDRTGLAGRVVGSGVRAGEPVTDLRLVGRGLTALLPAGQVAAPVRPSDLAVTGLVRAGDRVDVLATAADAARAERVTTRALVLAAAPDRPTADSPESATRAGTGGADGAGAPEGLLLLAVDPDTAARLAAASAGATLTVTLSGP